MRNKTTFIMLFLVCLVASGATTSEAQTRTRKTAKTISARKKALLQEQRRKEVEAWMLGGKYQHDGSGELAEIGTIESVPTLLKVLKDHPGRVIERMAQSADESADPVILATASEAKPRKTYICTYAHAVTALRRITSQKFFEYEDWVAWWDDYLKTQVAVKQIEIPR